RIVLFKGFRLDCIVGIGSMLLLPVVVSGVRLRLVAVVGFLGSGGFFRIGFGRRGELLGEIIVVGSDRVARMPVGERRLEIGEIALLGSIAIVLDDFGGARLGRGGARQRLG